MQKHKEEAKREKEKEKQKHLSNKNKKFEPIPVFAKPNPSYIELGYKLKGCWFGYEAHLSQEFLLSQPNMTSDYR
jgi:hypothetical protein